MVYISVLNSQKLNSIGFSSITFHSAFWLNLDVDTNEDRNGCFPFNITAKC